MLKKIITGMIALAISSFAAPEKIPLEILGKDPEIAKLSISPDGVNIAYMKASEDGYQIFVKNLENNEPRKLTDGNVDDFFWSDDATIIYSERADSEASHLYSVLLAEGKIVSLTPYKNITASIIDPLQNIAGKILIQMNKRNSECFDAYEVDTNTGKITLVAENPGDVTKWLADHNGKIRALEFTNGLQMGIRCRRADEEKWRSVATYNFTEKATPLMFAFDNKNLYVASNIGVSRQSIYTYDLETGKTIEQIYANPFVDVFEHPDIKNEQVFPKPLIVAKDRLVGVRFVVNRIESFFFERSWKNMQKFIDKRLPGYNNQIVSRDLKESKFIIFSSNDRTYGSYYLFDKKQRKLSKLFDRSPWIDERRMSSIQPISYTARDGMVIHGYLTLPKNRAKSLPLMVIPHGGPWDRDFICFNPEIQFFVNRGFAVLQMNFRGSIGYGRELFEAGFKAWGLKMQDDITDGVNWAIKKGVADPKKVVIYGASYGGYAALMGLIKTPELYAAAVDFAGITDLFALFNEVSSEREIDRAMLIEMIGDPIKDKEQLKTTSPIYNVDKINRPLFIVHGADDPRVNKKQADRIVEALRERSAAVEYMVIGGEGHGIDKEENIFDFYNQMEVFLQKSVKSAKEKGK